MLDTFPEVIYLISSHNTCDIIDTISYLCWCSQRHLVYWSEDYISHSSSRVQHNLSWWVHCVWWLLWLWADGYLFGGKPMHEWRHMHPCKGTQWLHMWLPWSCTRSKMWRYLASVYLFVVDYEVIVFDHSNSSVATLLYMQACANFNIDSEN